MDKILLKFSAKSQNESFARTCMSAFVLRLNPSVEELNDVKTAVSEIVTNSVVHAYADQPNGEIQIEASIENNQLDITITDFGKGIENVDRAIEPFFTTCEQDERSGMGFTIVQTFMNSLSVQSKPNFGTTVHMSKTFKVG